MNDKQEATQLKFLHCADIHLDIPYFGLTPEQSDERRRGLRENFSKMMDYVRNASINYVLISGDLFDTEYVTNNTAELLIRDFRNCPDTKFIIAPGKSDSYENNPIYTSGRLPSNVHVFCEDRLSRFDFDEWGVTVYGWAMTGKEHTENPLYEKTVDDVTRINIVCGYADLDGEIDSPSCPVSSTDLERFGADYYALGSRHEGSDFAKIGESIYSYSGSLECTGFDAPGIGGANLIVVDYKDGELAIDVKRVSFGHLRFVTEEMDITGVDAQNEIVNRISRRISEKKYGQETALRVELTGKVDPYFSIPQSLESDAFGLYYFDLVDKTLPLYGTDHFLRDMTAAGEVYRQMLPMLESEDEGERLTAARALRVALLALEGKDLLI
jgi:DNA repair exonuclease SbcCD nuclease subunit